MSSGSSSGVFVRMKFEVELKDLHEIVGVACGAWVASWYVLVILALCLTIFDLFGLWTCECIRAVAENALGCRCVYVQCPLHPVSDLLSSIPGIWIVPAIRHSLERGFEAEAWEVSAGTQWFLHVEFS